ncbi:MAG: hypothetical protein HKM03_09515 [Steroidobacteraceae bacterium]|nr:hypothetical protein [Steroidobacteraceae bacterium]
MSKHGTARGRRAASDWVIGQLRGLASPAPGVFSERRSVERRRRRWWSALYGSFRPRRRGTRRHEDSADFQVLDWHSSHLLIVAITIVLLCAGDAALTLRLLSAGAFEANPLMAFVLGRDAALFAAAKIALTAVGVVVLVSFARYRFLRRIRAEFALYTVLIGYAVLIGYEFWLLRGL